MRSKQGVFFCAVGLSLLYSSADAQTRMPRGAYLLHPAPDSQALAQQVRTNRTVLSRYVAIFHLPPNSVKRAFSQMHLITLKHDGIFQVHYVHPGEQLGYRLRRVRKGTRVFATADGTPIVAQVCGNPLRSSPGIAMMSAAVEGGRLTNIPDFAPDEPRLAEATDFTPTEHVMRNAEPVTDSMEETETVSTVAEEPIPPVPIEVLPGKSLKNWATSGLLALGGLAGLHGGSGSGGQKSGGSSSGGDIGHNGSGGGGVTLNAPEPGIAGLLFSATAMVGAYARSRRRRTP